VKIGVISDTHDNLINIRKAVAAFTSRRVDVILHGGDFCSPFTLPEFAPLTEKGVKMHAIFGNNDGDRVLLTKRGEGFCTFRDGVYVLTLDGRRIAMMHYPDVAEDLFRAGTFDLVVYGHNHQAKVEGTEKKLLNPGTCSGYLAPRATVAVVDTLDMAIELVTLE
jgi:putative phosphoesterase